MIMATRYQNGKIPLSALIQLDSGGGKHWSTPHTAALWYALRGNVKRKYGVTLHITAGWNAYRPYDEQVAGRKSACAQGNCLAAADPGTSSHGGTWWDWRTRKTVDAMALDIGDWWQLKEATFYAECRAVGLAPGLITKAVAGRTEEWHVIDLAPWGPIPAGLESKPFQTPKPALPEEEDEDMAKNSAFIYTRARDKAPVVLLVNTTTGWWMEYISSVGIVPEGNNPVAATLDTGSYAPVSEAFANAMKASLPRANGVVVSGTLTTVEDTTGSAATPGA